MIANTFIKPLYSIGKFIPNGQFQIASQITRNFARNGNKKIVNKYKISKPEEPKTEKNPTFEDIWGPNAGQSYVEGLGMVNLNEDPTEDTSKQQSAKSKPKKERKIEQETEQNPRFDIQEYEDVIKQSEEMEERLSKKMARLGICSRRDAERLIESGVVKVNGKTALANLPVTDQDKITLYTKHGEKLAVKPKARMWVFFKPKYTMCTHYDPQKRMTIYDYLGNTGFKYKGFITSCGRLDYNSEGLILLTNDGEISRILENPASEIERTYMVRVFGRFLPETLQKIRDGATIKGVQYGPYWAEVDKRQTKNTWIRMKLTTGKNREIRRIMQKFSLRVNRLKRVAYGPFKIHNLKPGQIEEVEIHDFIKRKLYMTLRLKTEQKQKEEKQEKRKQELLGDSQEPEPSRLVNMKIKDLNKYYEDKKIEKRSLKPPKLAAKAQKKEKEIENRKRAQLVIKKFNQQEFLIDKSNPKSM